MTRQPTDLRRSTQSAVASIVAVVAVATLGTLVAADRPDQRVSQLQSWYSSVPDTLPPPPSLQPYFRRFVVLYSGYNALPDKKPTFGEWAVMHGVTDPVQLQAMLLLYQWAERNLSTVR